MRSRRLLLSAACAVAALLVATSGAAQALPTTPRSLDEVTADATAVVEFAETSRTVDELIQHPFPHMDVTRSEDTTLLTTVDYAVTGGTATPGADFALPAGTLTFAAGETTKAVPLQIYPDTVFEPDETIVVTLSSPSAGTTLGEASSLTVTITDGDAPRLQFDNVTYPATETGGAATITVTRTGDPAVPVGVTFATSNGTATAGSDYVATSGTLSFGAGEMSKTFTVTILEDDVVESKEVVRLKLSDPTDGAVLGAPSSATLTITDSPPDVVQFELAAQTFAEHAGGVQLTVTRTGNLGVPTTVDYARTAGTAAAGSDFTLTPGTLSFAAGDSTKTIPITITNDNESELPESVVVTLSSPGDGTELGSASATTLTIAASDQQPDALVSTARMTGYVGNDVYNTTGARQTRTLNARRTRIRTFFVRIHNDGQVRNTIAIRGTAAVTGSRVRYFSDGQEITTSLRSSTGWKVQLEPAAFKVVRVRIKVLAGARLGSVKAAKVTGTWRGDSVRVDVAKAAVKVVR